MRGSYPVVATQENWVHESLVSMIKTIHDKQDNNQEVPSWGRLIPKELNPDQSARLKGLTGIKSRLEAYRRVVAVLTVADRQAIFQILSDQNCIVQLLNGTSIISSLLPTYPNVHVVVSSLFVFAYEKLTDLGVRDRQYKIVFDSLEVNTCVFCGVERIMSPQEARQDQDHYLPKSIYPFAAANMRNLVPMCRCCNRDYKHSVDTLRDAYGNRRRAFDPYFSVITDISLVRSIPFSGVSHTLPAWWVDFVPPSEEAETWDQVFCIRTRYSRDVLNKGFGRWMGSFISRCKNAGYPVNLSDAQVLSVLRSHYEDTVIEAPVGLDFLKPKVFEMLIHYFERNDARVVQFVRDAVVGIKVTA